MQNEPRRMFYVKSNNKKNVKICASGVILYRIINNELQLLLMTYNNIYEDLGGRSQMSDIDIYHTAAREVDEESNGLINKNSILNRITTSKYVISGTCKYMLFIIKANDQEMALDKEQFGNREIHDDIPRIVDWIPYSELLRIRKTKSGLNFRLRNDQLFRYLKSLNPQPCLEISNPKSSDPKNIEAVYLF